MEHRAGRHGALSQDIRSVGRLFLPSLLDLRDDRQAGRSGQDRYIGQTRRTDRSGQQHGRSGQGQHPEIENGRAVKGHDRRVG